MSDAPALRRLVLDLTHHDGASLRAAAEFAAQLGAALHGVFVEDEALFRLAGMPFARELRLPTREWRALDAETIAGDFRAAAAQARRMLDQAARALGVAGGFEVLRGDPAACFAALPGAADIVVLPAQQLQQPRFEGAAGVLLLPPPPGARAGTVAVVSDARAGPLDLAARCAVAAGAPLLILAPSDALLREAAASAAVRGLPPERVALRLLAGTGAEALLQALGEGRERLVVLPRGAGGGREDARAGAVLRWRRVPVLLAGSAEDAP